MLSRIRKSMADKDQGFTLIELLVVIIIIGILAAIAIPVFLNQRKKGIDAGLKSDLKNAATNVETWATDNPAAAVPDELLAVAATSPTTGALSGLRVSTGNGIRLIHGTVVGTYCLFAFNANGSTAIGPSATVGKEMAYRSALGGMDATVPSATATCA